MKSKHFFGGRTKRSWGGSPGKREEEKQLRPISGLGFKEESKSSNLEVFVGSTQLIHIEDYLGTKNS